MTEPHRCNICGQIEGHGTPTKDWRRAHPDWTHEEHPPRDRGGSLADWIEWAVAAEPTRMAPRTGA